MSGGKRETRRLRGVRGFEVRAGSSHNLGLGFRVWFRVEGLGFGVKCLGFRVWGLGFGVSDAEVCEELKFPRIRGLGPRVWGLAFTSSASPGPGGP